MAGPVLDDDILPPWPLFIKLLCDFFPAHSLHFATFQGSVLGVLFSLVNMLALGPLIYPRPSSH